MDMTKCVWCGIKFRFIEDSETAVGVEFCSNQCNDESDNAGDDRGEYDDYFWGDGAMDSDPYC